MVMLSRSFFLFLALVFSSLSWASSFSAHVDRQEVNEDDSFTLVLRYEGQALRMEPDLNPLREDFNLLAQQRSQQLSYTNGEKESFTNWIITLSPKRLGRLTIPAIKFSGDYSQPIEIQVSPLSAEIKEQAAKDFFFETKVTPISGAMVQGQLLYSEKLYYRYQHNNATLSELKVTDAKVQPLGEVRQYNTEIDGAKFGVYERHYAIFPEVSGELVIPGSRFNATLVDRYSWQGRPVRATAAPIRIEVASIPNNYPQNASWLATNKLVIEEQFSTPLNQWQQGDAITRTITLKAQGIMGSQLPKIQLPVVDGVRYYPDQIEASDHINNLGILGVSQQSIAMVITATDEVTLPEIRIPWWNLETQSLEYARLPAHQISLLPARSTANQPPQDAPAQAIAPASPSRINAPHSPWAIGIFVLALIFSVVLNVSLLWQSYQRRRQDHSAISAQDISLNSHWRSFAQACTQAQPAAIRQHLLAWINAGGLAHLTLTRPVINLASLAEQIHDTHLHTLLKELDSALFAPHSAPNFNALPLLEWMKQAQQHATIDGQETKLYHV